MDRNGSNRNGGCRKDNTGIIIVWKMKKDAGIGCSGWGIIMLIKRYQWFIHDCMG